MRSQASILTVPKYHKRSRRETINVPTNVLYSVLKDVSSHHIAVAFNIYLFILRYNLIVPLPYICCRVSENGLIYLYTIYVHMHTYRRQTQLGMVCRTLRLYTYYT